MNPYLHNVASSGGQMYARENMCTERYYDMRHSCCEQSYCMLWCLSSCYLMTKLIILTLVHVCFHRNCYHSSLSLAACISLGKFFHSDQLVETVLHILCNCYGNTFMHLMSVSRMCMTHCCNYCVVFRGVLQM